MANFTEAQKDILDSLPDYIPAFKKVGQDDILLGTNLGTVEDQILGSADGNNVVRVARATWDFASYGGVIGAYGLGVTIPDNAIILDGMIDVVTTLTTAAADAGTVAVSVEGADDIVAAIAVSDVTTPWDAGLRAIIPLGTSTTAVKTTAAREITVTLAVQAATAGKFVVLLRYVMGG